MFATPLFSVVPRRALWRPVLAWGLMALGACAAQAAAPAADHPAVQRALAHLRAQSLLATADAYTATDLVQDDDGSEHVRLVRHWNGLPVIGGDVVVHTWADGRPTHLSQASAITLPNTLPTQASVAGPALAAQALAAFPHGSGHVTAQQQVVYARHGHGVLAWDVTVQGQQADGTPSRMHVLLNARTHAVLDRWDEIHTADAVGVGHALYAGEVAVHANHTSSGFALQDATRGNHYVVDMRDTRKLATSVRVTGSTNVWGDGTEADRQTVAVDAAYGQNMTWDYYLTAHKRQGIANDGKGASSRVHFGTSYDNAYWDDNCFCMTYGDGKTLLPLVSLDVAGHEMTHGVTARTANLVYSGESGGLNEATSDIFGTLVEFYANNPSEPGNYLIGEKLYTNGKALRYMNKPSKDGTSADCWYRGVGALDVHESSGVANHLFYLLAEGTTNGKPSPTCQAGNTRVATGTGTLKGIGRDKAGAIWYRALTVYMTSTTNYAGAKKATLSAATDLYGAGSAEVSAVNAAWVAVNR